MKNTRSITITALSAALIFLFTWVVRVPGPITGGLVHMGNVPFFVASIVYGPYVGAIAGAIGMGMFDIFSGYIAWAPITVITCLIMGYVLGNVTKRFNTKNLIIGFVLMVVIKVLGYYFGEVIMYKSFVAPFASIPGNIVQILLSAVVVFIIINPIRKGLKNI
ncbi:ECF transporter S component [Peptoniphilus sp.]|uniref:ECF transporter S component n=1 Tax=Peptoniphilus sp. TaxID=1971214 RepID=UPI00399453B6